MRKILSQPGSTQKASGGHENKLSASKSWPWKPDYGRQGPRKQAERIKVVAPKSLSQPGSTQKTSGRLHSRGPGKLISAGKYPESKLGASKSWPREAYHSWEVPRKLVGGLKVVAPGGLFQPGSTQKTSRVYQSRGPREALRGRKVPRKQVGCLIVVVPGLIVPPGGVSSRLRKEKSKLGRSISAIFTPLKAGTPD